MAIKVLVFVALIFLFSFIIGMFSNGNSQGGSYE